MTPTVDRAVERRAGLTLAGFRREYDQPQQPVVLTDAVQTWAALRNWTPAQLRRTLGARQVSIDGSRYTIAEVLDRAEASNDAAPGPYLRECALEKVFPELLADIRPAPLYGPGRLHSRLFPQWRNRYNGVPELFIGGRGAGFPVLHFDLLNLHAIITQVYGRKSVWLYPPNQSARLYPRNEQPNLSRIETPNAVDLHRYPDYALAVRYAVTLTAGETLFVPSGWWHHTYMPELSITVAINAASASNWRAFSIAHTHDPEHHRPLRQHLKRTYMHSLGLLMSARERARDLSSRA